LEWQPPADWRDRDEDNPYGTLKVAADALVDAKIVPKDTPEWMTKNKPVILPGVGTKGRMWLVVTVDQAAEVGT
jgi:crossover junction endodeoxyribonuclease RusA